MCNEECESDRDVEKRRARSLTIVFERVCVWARVHDVVVDVVVYRPSPHNKRELQKVTTPIDLDDKLTLQG